MVRTITFSNQQDTAKKVTCDIKAKKTTMTATKTTPKNDYKAPKRTPWSGRFLRYPPKHNTCMPLQSQVSRGCCWCSLVFAFSGKPKAPPYCAALGHDSGHPGPWLVMWRGRHGLEEIWKSSPDAERTSGAVWDRDGERGKVFRAELPRQGSGGMVIFTWGLREVGDSLGLSWDSRESWPCHFLNFFFFLSAQLSVRLFKNNDGLLSLFSEESLTTVGSEILPNTLSGCWWDTGSGLHSHHGGNLIPSFQVDTFSHYIFYVCKLKENVGKNEVIVFERAREQITDFAKSCRVKAYNLTECKVWLGWFVLSVFL